MSEQIPEYDVIVIGAGAAGGLPVGAYLQKAGASVLLIDGNNSPGIHCRSYEYYQGAKCVPCAGGFAGGMMPMWEDLELEDFGADMIVNRRTFGAIFPDETSLFIGMDALRTLKDIAKFSFKDAWTYGRIGKRIEETQIELNERLVYSPPSPENMKRAMEIAAYCTHMSVDQFMGMNAFELLDHLFEDDRIKQVLFQPGGSVCLFNPFNKGEGALGVMMLHFCGGGMLRGSNRALVDSVEQVFFKYGGSMWLNSPIERIVVDNGKATGVQMSDRSLMFPGQIVKAKKAVVSNTGAIESLRLIGEDVIEIADPSLAYMMKGWDVKHRPSVATVWNLKHPPRWKAAKNDPYCKRADWVYLGLDNIHDWGKWFNAQLESDPEGGFQGWWETFIPGLVDPSQTGEDGSVTLRIESVHPHLRGDDGELDLNKWEDHKWDLAQRMTAVLDSFAPGFKESVIEIVTSSPVDIWRADPAATWGCAADASVPGDVVSQWYDQRVPYRMPIKQLYLCKGPWPIAFTWCATGYNAACVVAEDLGIRDQPWWKAKPGVWFKKNLKRMMKSSDEAAAIGEATWYN